MNGEPDGPPELCELFARARIRVAFQIPAGGGSVGHTRGLTAPDAFNGHTLEERPVCPDCREPLRFETDPLMGYAYEVCVCGYVARFNPAQALARYQADQRRLVRACLPFKLPPQHRGIRRVTVTCSVAA